MKLLFCLNKIYHLNQNGRNVFSLLQKRIDYNLGHFWPHLWKSGVVIQKPQFLKINEKINKNATNMFYEEYLEYKYITIFHFKDFEK